MATRTIRRGLGSRLGDSFKGVFFGIVLFLVSFVLLWWNEGRAVRQYKQLNEVRREAVAALAEPLDPANEGRLLHVTGRATTPETLADPVFGLDTTAIHLRRSVEMYQWRETEQRRTRQRVGGSEETVITYSHRTEWSGQLIDSSRFEEPSPERRNPQQMPYSDWTGSASQVALGDFALDTPLIQAMRFYEDLSPERATLPEGAQRAGQYVYIGADPAQPRVGDVRVSFRYVPESEISVLARQSGSRLTTWSDSVGQTYVRVQRGIHTKDAMIAQARGEVRIMTWILRLVGWLMMLFGLNLVLQPLTVMSSVLPFLGRVVGGGLFLASALLSAVLSLVTIAVAWVWVRPLVGVPMLIAAVALLVVQMRRAKKGKQATVTVPAS